MKRADGTETGNKVIALRLPEEIQMKLKEALELTGLKQAGFVRLAIVEKAEREIIKRGGK